MSRLKNFDLTRAIEAVPARTVLTLTFHELIDACCATHAHQGLDLRPRKLV